MKMFGLKQYVLCFLELYRCFLVKSEKTPRNTVKWGPLFRHFLMRDEIGAPVLQWFSLFFGILSVTQHV